MQQQTPHIIRRLYLILPGITPTLRARLTGGGGLGPTRGVLKTGTPGLLFTEEPSNWNDFQDRLFKQVDNPERNLRLLMRVDDDLNTHGRWGGVMGGSQPIPNVNLLAFIKELAARGVEKRFCRLAWVQGGGEGFELPSFGEKELEEYKLLLRSADVLARLRDPDGDGRRREESESEEGEGLLKPQPYDSKLMSRLSRARMQTVEDFHFSNWGRKQGDGLVTTHRPIGWKRAGMDITGPLWRDGQKKLKDKKKSAQKPVIREMVEAQPPEEGEGAKGSNVSEATDLLDYFVARGGRGDSSGLRGGVK